MSPVTVLDTKTDANGVVISAIRAGDLHVGSVIETTPGEFHTVKSFDDHTYRGSTQYARNEMIVTFQDGSQWFLSRNVSVWTTNPQPGS